jgi:non-ribosomal peptide synthetase-like protein
VLFFGAVLGGLVFMGTVPRLLNRAIKPGKVYPLYGFHYWVQRAIARTTNRKFYTRLFGDSSYIVHYLRWLGYDLRGVQQTGSNFGEDVKHDTPFLSAVGSGTVVADGLSIINADFSNTSFRLSRVSIGAHNFLGNRIAYPAQGRTGDNCLLATKLMVPVDGQAREGVGLLGAPSFEIPRSVERDRQLDVGSADELRRGLWAKNVHNTITMALFLLVRWIFFFAVTVLYLVAADVRTVLGAPAVVLAGVGVFFFTATYWVLVDRMFRSLQALRPQGCSIYDRAFWRHERFWKISADTYLNAFNGTPLKSVIWRLLGVRIGRRVFDDGCFLTERTFTTIGDEATLNAGSVIQCHSQEDGGFKSDRTVIGAGCTLGVGAFVHYGVTMGDGAVLAADSFLMKGEEMPPDAQWGGNPAKKMRGHSGDLQVRKMNIDDNYAAELVRV